MKYLMSITVNGQMFELAVPAKRTLAELLREDLDLTGTKQGCGEGECGACTVLMNGLPVNSCLILALEADNKEITTIEGMADGNELHQLQHSFIEVGAVQCGYCTPGMLLTSKALLDQVDNPSGRQIREALSGNLCRCTGYQKIVEAVSDAATKMADQKGGAK
jgi:aerobic carbon-monoxide dehydrogenase small subunit